MLYNESKFLAQIVERLEELIELTERNTGICQCTALENVNLLIQLCCIVKSSVC